MVEPRAGDRAAALVVAAGEAGGRPTVTLELRHATWRPAEGKRRPPAWTWCQVVVACPEGFTAASGTAVDVVLAATAEAGRVADAPGLYSCRLHAAAEVPVIPIERSTERIWAGLVERTEPPAGGALVLHLGSGLTCYVEPAGEGPFPPEALEHGTFAEFILEEPFRALWLRPRA